MSERLTAPEIYKTLFRSLDLRDVKSEHIQRTPRWDLEKVFVFTSHVPADKLRADLEEKIGVKPNISSAYAIQSVLYVFPIELPEGMPTEIREAVVQNGMDTNAVFIRGATNPFCAGRAHEVAGKLVHGALKELKRKFGDKIGWRFAEAENLLDTAAVLVAHDQELARMEYGSK